MDFAVTECPNCKKLIITVEDDISWQYICTCGTAFQFKVKDDGEETGE